MSTRWETIAIPFQGGIDTKSDAKAAPMARLTELENGVFTKRGSIRKRHGYDKTDAVDVDGLAVAGNCLGTFSDSLVMLDEGRALTYQDADDAWNEQGYFNRVVTTVKQVQDGPDKKTLGDQAEVNGVGLRAWVDGSGDIQAEVYNAASGARITTLTLAMGSNPRCVASGKFLHLVYALGISTDLMSIPINTFKPSEAVIGDAVIIASDLHADEVFDACTSSNGDSAIFAWYSTGSDELRWGRLLPGGSTESKNGRSTNAIVALAIDVSSTHLLIGHVEASAIVTTSVGDVNGGLAATPDTDSEASAGYERVSVACSDERYAVLFENQTTKPENQTIEGWIGYDVSEPSAAGYTGTVLRHSHLLSSGFSIGDKIYMYVGHESAKQVQNSAFLLELLPDSSGGSLSRVVSQMNYGSTPARTTDTRLPRASVDDAGLYSIILPYQKKAPSTNDDKFLHESLSLASATDSDAKYRPVAAGGALYAPGGILWYLDGGAPVESGFLLFPELDIEFGSTDPADHEAVTLSGGGNLSAGTYGYKVFYEWIGENGERQLSSAISFSVAVSGSQSVELEIPTLFHTHKGEDSDGGTREDVSIVVYRTAANLNTYNRVSSADPTDTGSNGYIVNDRTADYVTFDDDLADATSNEVDPTRGGALDNISPPSSAVAIDANRRLWLAGGEIADNRVAYSKLRADGGPIEYNDALTVELPDEGGPVVGLHALGDAIVIFKNSQIYAIAGDGPNNNGYGDFQQPVQIATDVGCIDSRSIVETPEGLMFQSQKGIYMINKGYQVVYAGAEAEGFNDQVISGANLIPDQNAVLFLSSDGTSLWYDYLFGQWSTFTGHQGVSGALFDGKYRYLRANGELMTQSTTSYTDGGSAYRLRAKTAPIRMGGLQEYWRCKRLYILGERFSEHSLRTDVWFNRERAPQETVIFTPADFIDDGTWGSEATWGADDTWGGDIDSGDYQMSYGLARQKCQSVTFEFTEIPGAEPGRSFELTELALLWGSMGGLGRLASARRK
jgi:hypothetical protein